MIGTDNLKELDTWKYIEELLDNFKIIVLKRGEQEVEDIIDNSIFLRKYKDSFIIPKNKIVTNLSSTCIRERIQNGESIKYLVPEKIISYIEKNNLYKEVI